MQWDLQLGNKSAPLEELVFFKIKIMIIINTHIKV